MTEMMTLPAHLDARSATFDVPKLLGRSSKSMKGEALGYLSRVLYLASADRSGHDVCPHASPGCRAACLGRTSNWMQLEAAQSAQLRRTMFYFADPQGFGRQLQAELEALSRSAARQGLRPAARLNGSSDLDFTAIVAANPLIDFYDYTKNPELMERFLEGELPPNYHLTFSRSESNWANCLRFLERGGNVAVAFRKVIPDAWQGYAVVDGTGDDLRFLDPRGTPGVIVGLRAWGAARKDRTRFVIDP